jgi:hypothetical protein
MMKKIAYVLIGCLCTLVLTYSYYAYADQGAGTASSKEMTGVLAETPGEQGKLKFTNEAGPQELTLAKSAWVYRDQQKAVLTDLKVGDKLEVIVNTNKQAAFIKAYSAASALPEQQNAAVPQASVSSSAITEPSASTNGTVPVPSASPPLRIIQEFNLSDKQADLQLEVKWMANQGVQQQEQDKGSHDKDNNDKDSHNKDKGKHEKENKSHGEGKKEHSHNNHATIQA